MKSVGGVRKEGIYQDSSRFESTVIREYKSNHRCQIHNQFITMYNMTSREFICDICIDKHISPLDECYPLNELYIPASTLYMPLIDILNSTHHEPLKLDLIKEKIEIVPNPTSRSILERELRDLKFEHSLLVHRVDGMREQYMNLKEKGDFEGLLAVNERWSAICFDYRSSQQRAS